MAGIRKQAIISSILVYIGVLFGALNTYLFVKEGHFTPEQYGLTRLFFDVGQNFYVFASLGAIPVIYKFYHYYNDNLDNHENDLLGRSFIISLIGFALVTMAAYFLEPMVIRKFGARSALFVQYYFRVLPFSFGLLAFSVMEGYATALQKTVLPNFLKETGIRMITTVFILLYFFGFISFNSFMMLFAMLYVIIAIILAIAMAIRGDMHFHFKASRVTKKFKKKMLAMQLFVFGGIVISTLGLTIDGMIIASLRGLIDTGVYTFALYIANLIQIPQRSIQSIATGVLVRLWKDKNYEEINRIYQRSCINMLIISVFLFGNLWLNIADGLQVLNIQDKYTEGIPLVLILGVIRIIDAGTGVNAQVIGASNFWKFEFVSGVIMLALRIPLSYIFIKQYGIIGTAFSDLISLSVYNFIRFEFLRRKFGMQPFNIKMLFALILSGIAFSAAYFLFRVESGWFAIIARSIIFSSIVIAGTFFFKLTPDAMQLIENARKRLKI